MNPGAIWWGQIGNSLRLLTKVTNCLRDCRSAVLQVPQSFPWRHDFYEAVDTRRSAFSGERRLIRLPWEEAADPGEFVLRELCSGEVRAEYWPGQTYAAYLGSLGDIVLNEYYVWVTGIHRKADIGKWAEFVSQYVRHSEELEQRAVFLLEYDGAQWDPSGMETIPYSVENYDCRVFCLETAAALGNTTLRDYQAELALCIGEGDPELCAALLSTGKELLSDPIKTTQRITSEEVNSEGKYYRQKTEQQISSAAWNAAIVLLFPALEHYRMGFVAKHEAVLSRHLPISNSNGDRVTDPYDLEIGAIYYIIGTSEREFTALEADNIRLCRKARNLLAHNRPLPYSDVLKIAALA